MDIPYVLNSDTSFASFGNLPDLPLVNMVVDKYGSEPDETLIESRLAITPWSPNGINSTIIPAASPTKAIFQLDGVFCDGVTTFTYFSVSNGHLWKTVYTPPPVGGSTVVTDLGAISGSGPVKIVGEAGAVFVTAGTTLYYYNGTTLSTVSTPGGFNVRDIVIGASRLIVVDDGTGKLYWSDPLGTSLPSINFATAEYSPDNLLGVLYVGDTLVLLGSQTVEFWPSTGDPDSPFQPIVGKTQTVGLLNRASNTMLHCLFDGGFAWITNRGQVCVNNQDSVITTPGMELLIGAATGMFSFWMNGREFLVVHTSTITWVYSARSKTWSRFASDGRSLWTASCYAGSGAHTFGIFGSQYHGALLTMTGMLEQDLSGSSAVNVNFERRFRAGIPLTTSTLKIDSLTLRTNPGVASPTGTVNLKVSRDGGQNWSSSKPRTFGPVGSYRRDMTWRSLGQYANPGFLAEFQLLDTNMGFRVSGVKANEPRVGH